jgi:protease-4
MGKRGSWLLTLLLLAGGTCVLALAVGLLTSWLQGSGGLSLGDRIAVVRLEGMITDARGVLESLDKQAKDPRVKALVIRVDSPGGAVAPTQEVFNALRFWSQRKKVVASLGSMATSGGYYVACASDRIVANPGTITGSIGVVVHMASLEGLLEKLGVKGQVIKSGQHKDMGSVFRALSDTEKSLLQEVVDDVHDQFVMDVARSRGMEIERVRNIADGRIFSGRQAKDLGLVDELGGLQEAIQVAARLAEIKGDPVVVEEPRERFSIWKLLLGKSKLDPLWGSVLSPHPIAFLFYP